MFRKKKPKKPVPQEPSSPPISYYNPEHDPDASILNTTTQSTEDELSDSLVNESEQPDLPSENPLPASPVSNEQNEEKRATFPNINELARALQTNEDFADALRGYQFGTDHEDAEEKADKIKLKKWANKQLVTYEKRRCCVNTLTKSMT